MLRLERKFSLHISCSHHAQTLAGRLVNKSGLPCHLCTNMHICWDVHSQLACWVRILELTSFWMILINLMPWRINRPDLLCYIVHFYTLNTFFETHRCLPPIAKMYVLRLLYLEVGVASKLMEDWILPDYNSKHKVAIDRLVQLRVFLMPEGCAPFHIKLACAAASLIF